MNIKIIKKSFQNLFIVLFFIIFSFFYGKDFLEFQKEKKILESEKQNILENIESFTLNDIREIGFIELFSTPDLKLLEKIVNKIDTSKKRVYLEVYMLTEKRIIEALVKAKKRNIDVKVILEKNPYKSPKLNDKAYNKLKKSGIKVVWSNPKNYSLNHLKLLLIDDDIIISTGNMSHSTFISNKDIFVFIKDDYILSSLENIFINDFNGINISNYNDNLLLSPDYSRKKINTLIISAKKDIKLYFPYLKDIKLNNLLLEKAGEGIKVSIIVSKKFYQENLEYIKQLKEKGIFIEKIKKYKMHSKAILVDNKYLFIGSINFSTYSLDKNREVGIFIKDAKIIKNFLKIWE